MQVQCPDCGTVSKYTGSFVTTKRPRKKCPSKTCKCKFEVKSHLYTAPSAVANNVDQGPQQGPSPGPPKVQCSPVPAWVFENLDQSDLDLVRGLLGGETQASIAKARQVKRSTIHKQVKRLTGIGILIEKPTWPRTYELLPELKAMQLKVLKAGMRVHHTRVRMDILFTAPIYYQILPTLKQIHGVQNWNKYHVTHNYVTFEINETKTPNITFVLTCAGRSSHEAKENLLEKVIQARDWLEDHLHVTLGDAEYKKINEKDRPHAVFLKCTDAQLERYKQVWNDRSDPAAEGVAGEMVVDPDLSQADAMLDALNGHENLQEEVKVLESKLETKITSIEHDAQRNNVDLKKDLDNLRGDVATLTRTISTLVQQIQFLADRGGYISTTGI